MKRLFSLALLATAGGALAIGLTAAPPADAQQSARKIQICHGTASKTNPYVLISVDANAVQGHFDGTAPGHGKNNYPDYLAVNGTCSTTPPSNPPSGGS